MDRKDSQELFFRAQRVVPGGVNSPVRAFRAVGGTPVYFKEGHGSRVTTEDGDELIDFCCSWGPLILGHARAEVVAAVQAAAARGLSFGANTRRETEFCELICDSVSSIDKLRLVNSGTEAVMTALRLARGHTGRRKIIKFDGCYHGHTDCMLAAAGSGVLHGGSSGSAGVADSVAAEVFVAPYNDSDAVRRIVAAHGDDIAAIIVEPIAGNMGLVAPDAGFLEVLRAQADSCKALLIFDEVITGFRLGPTTYGDLRGISPDLTTFGKIIGGGMPIGALGGRREVMDGLAPLGDVYQGGTLSGNPVAVAAGIATLQLLFKENPYPRLAQLGTRLADGVDRIAAERGLPIHCAQSGSLFTIFFREQAVRNLGDAKACDGREYARFFQYMLANGIYLPPSPFELNFLSTAHSEAEIDRYLELLHRACLFHNVNSFQGSVPAGITDAL